MINVNCVSEELELILSDIAFSGFENIPPAYLERLDLIAGRFSKLGMERGVLCVKSFISAVSGYRRGGSLHKAAGSFCALEFYLKNIQNG